MFNKKQILSLLAISTIFFNTSYGNDEISTLKVENVNYEKDLSFDVTMSENFNLTDKTNISLYEHVELDKDFNFIDSNLLSVNLENTLEDDSNYTILVDLKDNDYEYNKDLRMNFTFINGQSNYYNEEFLKDLEKDIVQEILELRISDSNLVIDFLGDISLEYIKDISLIKEITTLNKSKTENNILSILLDNKLKENKYYTLSVFNILDDDGLMIYVENSFYDFYKEDLSNEIEEDIQETLIEEDNFIIEEDNVSDKEEKVELNSASDKEELKDIEEIAMEATTTPNTGSETIFMILLAILSLLGYTYIKDLIKINF